MAYKVGRCLLSIRLREARMTQQELSDKIGMPRQQISNYITGVKKEMRLSTARTIAKAVGCQIEDLYEWIEVK